MNVKGNKMSMKWVITTILSLSVLLGAAVSTGAEILVSGTRIYEHGKSSGGKGVDSVSLKAPETAKNSCAVFVKAQIKYTKRHYGKVEIIQHPKTQCNPKKEQCKLGVSWEHSPAGRLGYMINVTWALKPC